MMGGEMKVTYMNIVSAHPILTPEDGWIMVEVTDRRSQFIALCLRFGLPCDATYNNQTKEVTIVGDFLDQEGLNNYENVMILQKPAGPNYHATLIMINGRVSTGVSQAIISINHQNPLCSKCKSDNGGCEDDISCVCNKGYFGRTCSKSVTTITSETTKSVKELRQFETMHLEDYYDAGETDTQFTLQSSMSAFTLFLVNENDNQNYDLTFRENKESSSAAFAIDRWSNSQRQINLTIQKKWMICSLMNLAPQKQIFTITVFRVRTNTFNTVSLILYILMVIAIGLLVMLSICVICIKMRNSNRVRQMTVGGIAGNGKLSDKDIEKYLPIVKSNDDVFLIKDPCTICLETNDAHKQVRKVFMCGHLFHSECLLDWVKLKEFCPNCKKDFSLKSIAEFEKAKLLKPDEMIENKGKLRDPESVAVNPNGLSLAQSSLVGSNNRINLLNPSLNQQVHNSNNNASEVIQNRIGILRISDMQDSTDRQSKIGRAHV